ncbi:MAG: hypothetical protein AB4290_31565 [Spirulina sp.]
MPTISGKDSIVKKVTCINRVAQYPSQGDWGVEATLIRPFAVPLLEEFQNNTENWQAKLAKANLAILQ